jgi:hypothetical protein
VSVATVKDTRLDNGDVNNPGMGGGSGRPCDWFSGRPGRNYGGEMTGPSANRLGVPLTANDWKRQFTRLQPWRKSRSRHTNP